ncbi:MAG: sulfurtransferase TusA family protein [Halorhodospira halophila]|uniref:sulfurtransferase TusA family protein n=1 Tax=Halorhodospira TaxID=85108 RepID=UPI001911F148|nr:MULTISPECIES: sulfurtransferase TusA family protein [Halorhodospira]MBK5936338.1 SirA family protein [Halorhodospira halophila]MBK5943573.1 SirA family protein [Halorhodospira halophila]MCC3750945.1 sulfurtransferase TusA family protein [Halorhodospira halophila]MCG5527104.1 sulfurtransferase TusA family protein [Halorhodospira halophila]MCG5534255.1 sulfurtransferase TusA family protein [Halorhodospira sp. 9621]
MATDNELDCRHLLCPLPVIRTQAQVARLVAGDELEVVVTDPGALEDIPAWCRVHGHEVIATEPSGDEHRIRIRVGGA